MRKYFGTDGIRRIANSELTPELVYKVAKAGAYVLSKHTDHAPTIFIGRDTRISGTLIESAMTAGFLSYGANVKMLGVMPTPAVAYLTKKFKADASVVISASHNTFEFNGVKYFSNKGMKIPDELEEEIEEVMESGKLDELTAVKDKIGVSEVRTDLLDEYVSFVTKTTYIELEGMKIVLDCANGAAYEAMPKILRRLGADVIVIHDKPNGININDNCGSTHLESLMEAVKEHKADIGIAHDGDADRCLCIDENGEFIDGDHMIAACAIYMMGKGKLKDNTVVTTVMANIGFHKAIKENGGRTEITAVGDRYVLENMLANGYNLGGEQSGHIIFTDFSTTGDGPVTALQVLSYLKRTRHKASAITKIMTSYPQLLVNVKVATKDGWEDNEAIKASIEEGKQQLGENGRILVRPSGTEPLIRVMAEGPDQKELEEICYKIADVVKAQQG